MRSPAFQANLAKSEAKRGDQTTTRLPSLWFSVYRRSVTKLDIFVAQFTDFLKTYFPRLSVQGQMPGATHQMTAQTGYDLGVDLANP